MPGWHGGLINAVTDASMHYIFNALMQCSFNPYQGRITLLFGVGMLLFAFSSIAVLPGSLIFVWGS